MVRRVKRFVTTLPSSLLFRVRFPDLPFTMRLKTIIMAAALIAVAAPVSAQSLEVNPDTFGESIVAGETVKKNITLEWSGETDTVAKLHAIFKSYSGENASEGFTATFSRNPVIVDEQGQTVVLAEIETHPALTKDKYTVQIQAESQIEKEVVKEEDSVIVYEDVYRENETLQEKLQELKEQRDNLSNQIEELEDLKGENENLSGQVQDLRNEQESVSERLENVREQRNELNRTIQVLESRSEDSGVNARQNVVLAAVAGSILSLIALALFLGFVKRDELVSRVRAWRKNDMFSDLSSGEGAER